MLLYVQKIMLLTNAPGKRFPLVPILPMEKPSLAAVVVMTTLNRLSQLLNLFTFKIEP